ncbi:GIY-YIG nuclease family protein [bacterium]|nr:MAG: GIY-YIG nuclease family protein [bacterium]
MNYVYILRSKKDKSLYIGFYPYDLRVRLMKHHQGLVKSTRNIRPLELIYYEAYKSKKDAMIREKRLKKFAKGYASLRGRLKYSLLTDERKGEGC